jgi:MFS family permease
METREETPSEPHLKRESSQASTTIPPPGDEELHPHLTITKSLEQTPKRQIAIVIFVSLAQFVQMYPYGAGIASALSIATSFYYGTDKSTQVIAPPARSSIAGGAAWIAASYPLTQGTFVLMGGRLGAVYGHKIILMVACAWWLIWQLVTGFAPNLITLCVFRGLSGIGGGFMTPNAVALLGITFPPGKKRNTAMALFGAMAPVGAAGASLFAAMLVQLTEWKWVFFFP